MTIKTNILIIFLSLVGIVAFSLLFSQYYLSEKLAIKSTNKTFHIISKNISDHIHKEGITIRKILNVKSTHKDLLEPITFNPMHPSFEDLVQVLQRNSNLHAIYFAHPDGRFYEIINLQCRPLVQQTLHAPDSSHWAIITIIDHKQQNAFLDKHFNLISKKSFNKKYDVQSRPWYSKAVNSSSIITTMPYFFSHSHQMGVTYAKQLDKKGFVLALDYTMDQLNEILALQKFDEKSEVFIVGKDARKFASSAFINSETNTQTKKLDPKLEQVVLEKKIDQTIKYTDERNNYFVIFTALVNKNQYLGIKVDSDALLKPYKDSIQYLMLIAF
ncbi:MAG: cache domain-containing protein, partial [Bacteroidales bacterium]|nr:cache domain-containing protein [Bacteroidales bacterium]